MKLRAERVLVAAGDGERIVTAGGGSSWHDLLLYLIARFIDPVQSVRIAKLFPMQYHGDSQLPYARATINSQHSDHAIAEAQAWVSHHYPSPAPVTAMAQQTGLAERTFKRRFKTATSMSPIAYVHNLRLEEAKQMLESGSASVESIAVEVGYDDPTFSAACSSARPPSTRRSIGAASSPSPVSGAPRWRDSHPHHRACPPPHQLPPPRPS